MIIFLYGEDSFRSHRFLEETKKKFIQEQDKSASSVEMVDGELVSLEKINQLISAGSLFSKKRLVIVKNIFKNKQISIFEPLLNILKRLDANGEIIIIFRDQDFSSINSFKGASKKLFDFLKKQKFSQEFKALSAGALNKFIKLEFAKYDKTIEARAVSELIYRSGSDLWQMTSIIKKSALASSGKELSLTDVSAHSPEIFNDNIFSLIDAISEGRAALAIKILEEQYAAGLSDAHILNMLVRQFKLLLLAKDFLSSNPVGELSTKLKLHPFVAKKLSTQCRNFSYDQLLFYFNSLINLSLPEKFNTESSRAELNLLINQI